MGKSDLGHGPDGSGGDSSRGNAVAKCALRLTEAGDSILILAGKGHNGDDARAAHDQLSERRVVELLDVSSAETDLPKLDAAFAPTARAGETSRSSTTRRSDN